MRSTTSAGLRPPASQPGCSRAAPSTVPRHAAPADRAAGPIPPDRGRCRAPPAVQDRVRGAALASRSRRAPRVRPRASAARRPAGDAGRPPRSPPGACRPPRCCRPRAGVAITVGMPEQRMVGTRRLDREDVERRTAQTPAAERVDQRRLVDQRGARRVDEARSGLHARQRRGVDHPPGLVAHRRMQADEVATRQQRFEVDRLDILRQNRAGGQIRVVHDDGAAEAGQPRGDAPPHRPEADQADRLPPQLTALQAW